jgi:hypothetical protein
VIGYQNGFVPGKINYSWVKKTCLQIRKTVPWAQIPSFIVLVKSGTFLDPDLNLKDYTDGGERGAGHQTDSRGLGRREFPQRFPPSGEI